MLDTKALIEAGTDPSVILGAVIAERDMYQTKLAATLRILKRLVPFEKCNDYCSKCNRMCRTYSDGNSHPTCDVCNSEIDIKNDRPVWAEAYQLTHGVKLNDKCNTNP